MADSQPKDFDEFEAFIRANEGPPSPTLEECVKAFRQYQRRSAKQPGGTIVLNGRILPDLKESLSDQQLSTVNRLYAQWVAANETTD